MQSIFTEPELELAGIECKSVDWINQPCGRDMCWAVVTALSCIA
jgi:hypothetical protein